MDIESTSADADFTLHVYRFMMAATLKYARAQHEANVIPLWRLRALERPYKVLNGWMETYLRSHGVLTSAIVDTLIDELIEEINLSTNGSAVARRVEIANLKLLRGM